MKYFFDVWDIFKKNLSIKHHALFLDYDGTLAPIAQTPDKAFMTQEMRETLIALSTNPQCHVAVISGRQLSDLKNMISIPGLIYVGNHGFEMDGLTTFSLESMIPTQYEQDLRVIKDSLASKLSLIQGVWIEDKGIILTIHFRLATEKSELLVRKILMRFCKDYLQSQRIIIMEGKKVFEIRPPLKWGKGEAVCWLLSKWQKQFGRDHLTVMYVGDDTTDEDAFKVLNPGGLTIRVGQSEISSAEYFVNTQEEVVVLLRRIKELITSK